MENRTLTVKILGESAKAITGRGSCPLCFGGQTTQLLTFKVLKVTNYDVNIVDHMACHIASMVQK